MVIVLLQKNHKDLTKEVTERTKLCYEIKLEILSDDRRHLITIA